MKLNISIFDEPTIFKCINCNYPDCIYSTCILNFKMKKLIVILMLLPIIGIGQVKIIDGNKGHKNGDPIGNSKPMNHLKSTERHHECDSVQISIFPSKNQWMKFNCDSTNNNYQSEIPIDSCIPMDLPTGLYNDSISNSLTTGITSTIDLSSITSPSTCDKIETLTLTFITDETIKEYIDWCYKDSMYVKYVVDYSQKPIVKNDTLDLTTVGPTILLYSTSGEWRHKEPTFVGFYEWLKKQK